MDQRSSGSRRSFLQSVAAAPAVGALAAGAIADVVELKRTVEPIRPKGPNDRIRIATIGMGIIGFIDTDTALEVPGVELVAAADLYKGRRERVNEVYGDRVKTYVDYREILARPDVDAILVCVPDHWHARMSIDALAAGKAVYCEKPMIHEVGEGPSVIEAERKSGKAFQVGSQYAASILYDKVRDLIRSGAIGQLNSVEARYNRNSAIGAWQYSLPLDASAETVDWDRFLGKAPKREFDPIRFFRWRNYWDYGTAVAGDLFVHLLTAIHHATDSIGPTRIAAMGGRRHWNDGRDAYDVIMALLDYPQTEKHPSFTLQLQSNFEDGGWPGTLFRFVGNDGTISLSFTELTLDRTGIVEATPAQVLEGYNSVRTFSKAQQAAFKEKFLAEHPPKPAAPARPVERFAVPKGYNERLDHFTYFFRAVREGTPVYENATFGFRAAAPALLCNSGYREGKVFGWDPVNMKTID
ncbi:MAG: Gfo/Idh/MocA family oxidoreductase [Isosphaeraceae bacterium]|nr:Gfo/Idh/MocA family oxidoreductase [Isosphaeraceae bacterium]